MRKLIHTFTVFAMISSASVAATISDINLINVNGALRLIFKTDGKCEVEKSTDNGIVKLLLNNCKTDSRKVFGKQDGIVKVVDIAPTSLGTEVKVVPDTKVDISYVAYPKVTTILIVPDKYLLPEIKKTATGVVLDLKTDIPFRILKEKRKIIFISKKPVFKTMEKKLNSSYVDRVKTYSTSKASYLELYLKTDLPAQIVNSGNGYEVNFLNFTTRNLSNGSELKSKKIKLDFANTDVRTVVRAIADMVGVNVVFDPEVKGKVSIRFLTPVDWKDALKAVIEPLGFTYLRDDNYLRITSKKRILEETAYEPVNTYIVSLNYAYAEEVAKIVKSYLGNIDNKGKKLKTKELVEIDERTNSLILKVTEDHYKKIMDIVKHTDKMTRQVSIEARIVLIDTSFEKQLGVNWNFALWGSGSETYRSGSFQANDAVTIPGITTSALGNAATIATQPYTLAVGILKKDQSLRAELAIKASELTGDGKLVSQPKVVTLDNKEAVIEKGMEIPYKVIDENGNISTEFKKASLILKVKPHVTNNERIMLNLEIKKDKPNYDYVAITGNTEPAIDTRNVKTQIMVNNGDTLVIGGIYEQEKSKSKAGIPLLSKIPLLGWLFKNEVVKNSNSQLLIFITPKVISTGNGIGGGGK